MTIDESVVEFNIELIELESFEAKICKLINVFLFEFILFKSILVKRETKFEPDEVALRLLALLLLLAAKQSRGIAEEIEATLFGLVSDGMFEPRVLAIKLLNFFDPKD